MSTPAADLKSSPVMCGRPPGPVCAKLSSPGRRFARAMSSAADFAGKSGRHHEDLVALGEFRDRRELAGRIVAGARRHRRRHGEHAGVADEQRIAVGRRRDHGARADRAAGAGAVLDHRPAGRAGGGSATTAAPERRSGRPVRRGRSGGSACPDRTGPRLRRGATTASTKNTAIEPSRQPTPNSGDVPSSAPPGGTI